MKLKEAQYDTEVISQAPLDAMNRAKAAARKALITGNAEGTQLAQFDPNAARMDIDHPAVYPSGDDYSE